VEDSLENTQNTDDNDRDVSFDNADQAWKEILRKWGLNLSDQEERFITKKHFGPLF